MAVRRWLAFLYACCILQAALNAELYATSLQTTQVYDHVTPLLRVPERISFRLAVLAYCAQHNLAPPYLSDEFHRVADATSRQRLRSGTSTALFVPATVHSSIGDRAFPVAAARVWNSLPHQVTSSPSLPIFRQRLKTELFKRSYEC
jgi:hypothetical protein